ncbi:MAG: PAS domain S-box protein [Anaerolineae bacterium]
MGEESSIHSRGTEYQKLSQRLAEAEAALQAAFADGEMVPTERLTSLLPLLGQAQKAMAQTAQTHDQLASMEDAAQRTAELQQTHEELRVAEEELRQQNQELLTTRTALELERQHYHALFDLAPVGYLVTDPFGTIEEANQAAATLLGAPQHFLLGKPLPVFAAGSDRREMQHRIHQLREAVAEVPDPWHLQLQSRAGGPFDAHLWVVAMQDAGRQETVVGLRWLIRDVTEQRQAETALRASEERLRLIAEFTHDWEYWTGPDGRYVYVSPSCERITGHSPDGFLEDPGLFLRIVHPADRPAVREHLHAKHEGQRVQSMDFRIVTRAGEERWINHVCQPVHASDGSWMGYRGSNRDISQRIEMENALRQARNHMERRVHERTVELLELNETLRAEISARQQAEEDLRASEERFRQLAENIHEVFWLIEPDSGHLLYVSPAYEAIWGQSRDRLYDDATSFLHAVHEDDRQRIREIWEQGWQSRGVEFRLLRPDGTLRWIRARAFPIQDSQKRVYRIAGIAQDVTEQKQAQESLVQTERMGMAAQLAASLAHEINNPLQSVVGCLDLALEALDAGREPRKYIDVASKASERAARVVAQLRELHRRSRLEEKQVTNINHLVDNVLTLSQKRCRLSSVEVVWQKDPDLPQLELMPDAMQQIFLNLITNAIDAMPDGGRLQVSAERTAQPPGVHVAFADTGTGMPPEVLERLFEPFHTTKPDGLGLGLFISQNIAQQHGGHIDVESQADKGTIFNLWIPA